MSECQCPLCRGKKIIAIKCPVCKEKGVIDLDKMKEDAKNEKPKPPVKGKGGPNDRMKISERVITSMQNVGGDDDASEKGKVLDFKK